MLEHVRYLFFGDCIALFFWWWQDMMGTSPKWAEPFCFQRSIKSQAWEVRKLYDTFLCTIPCRSESVSPFATIWWQASSKSCRTSNQIQMFTGTGYFGTPPNETFDRLKEPWGFVSCPAWTSAVWSQNPSCFPWLSVVFLSSLPSVDTPAKAATLVKELKFSNEAEGQMHLVQKWWRCSETMPPAQDTGRDTNIALYFLDAFACLWIHQQGFLRCPHIYAIKLPPTVWCMVYVKLRGQLWGTCISCDCVLRVRCVMGGLAASLVTW